MAALNFGRVLLRTSFRWRRVLGGRCIGLLLELVGHFGLRSLEFIDSALLFDQRRLEYLDLTVCRIELLLLIERLFGHRLLQEIDVALQASGAAIHRLLCSAD